MMNTGPPLQRLRLPALMFFMLSLVVLALQVENEAYSSDFAGHPDEAAHVVTGLMVRDYLAGGFLHNAHPLRYAEAYYAAYPKVALGHYPPGFYAVAGVWLLPLPSPLMVLVLAALLTALCGTAVFCYGRSMLPTTGAMAAGLVFCLLPLSQQYTAIVMSDMLLVLFCVLATGAFAGFLKAPSARSSLAFGGLAAAAILTKASGLLLALLPPLALLFARRLDLLKNRKLWLAPLPVIALAAPWMLMTYHITKEGAAEIGFGEYVKASVPFYADGMWRVFGAALLLALLGGVLLATVRARRGGAHEAAMLALLASGLAFYIFVPSGFDDRYLLAIAPAAVLLAMQGLLGLAGWLASRWQDGRGGERTAGTLIVLGGLAFAGTAGWFEQEDKAADGFADCIGVIEQAQQDTGAAPRVLASSDARGEGALIAAAAFAAGQRPEGGITIARGSKRLADVKWLGQDYQLKLDSPGKLRDEICSHFDYLLVDRGIPASRRRSDHRLVEETIMRYPDAFSGVGTVAGKRATPGDHQIDIYRVAKP